MIHAISTALQFGFMRNAMAAGVMVSVACGIIGTYVVLNRIVFLSGGVAHAAYGGVGLAYYFSFSPILSAVAFSLGAALAMGYVKRHTRERSDTVIGVMWAIGMAIGIVFVDLSSGYKADLMSYLFGSILAVSPLDLWVMLALDLIILVLVSLFYRELTAISFDETFATVRNIPVNALYLMLVVLIGLTVVMLMRVVGLILVIALLTIPAAISNQFTNDLRKMMAIAVGWGLLFTLAGLWLSYLWNLTSGATIILVAGFTYMLVMTVQWVRQQRRAHRREGLAPVGIARRTGRESTGDAE